MTKATMAASSLEQLIGLGGWWGVRLNTVPDKSVTYFMFGSCYKPLKTEAYMQQQQLPPVMGQPYASRRH